MDKKLPHFWVYRYCKVDANVSKNTNTLLMDEWYIGIFQIDT
jgi:hypothetical protein